MTYTGRTYDDILVGEYEYIENGVVKINTLSNLNANLPNKWSHNIRGGYPKNSEAYPLCLDCTSNEKRMSMSLHDPIRNVSGTMTLRLISVNGTPALKMDLWGDGGGTYDESQPHNPEDFKLHVPITECILLKVND